MEVLDSGNATITNESNYTGDIRVKIWLYNDNQHTQKINNQKVPVILKYTYNKGVVIYDDIADFNYKAWDRQWNSKVDTLKTFIKIPGSSSEAQYWNMPSKYVKSSQWENDNELVTVAKDIPSNNTFSQRIIMPTSYFKSTENARLENGSQKENIQSYHEKIAEKTNFKDLVHYIFAGFLALIIIVPAGIYAIFGREPKTSYDREYEYDLPSNLKALEVYALFNGNVGSVSSDALSTAILDLIDRKYLKIVDCESDDTVLKTTDKSHENLVDYELDVIDYLSKFADSKGNISLKSIPEKETHKEYKKFSLDWQTKVEKSIPYSVKKCYFDDRGSKIFRYFFLVVFIISILLLVLSFIIHDVIDGSMAIVSFILVFVSFFLMVMDNVYMGRWTPEGRKQQERWANFKRYIEDYSLINERPPESIKIWGKYLVYASALGVADKATDAMKKYYDIVEVSDVDITSNDVALFAYNGGIDTIDSSFNILDVSDYGSDGGSSGSGGGFGGGGGGTF